LKTAARRLFFRFLFAGFEYWTGLNDPDRFLEFTMATGAKPRATRLFPFEAQRPGFLAPAIEAKRRSKRSIGNAAYSITCISDFPPEFQVQPEPVISVLGFCGTNLTLRRRDERSYLTALLKQEDPPNSSSHCSDTIDRGHLEASCAAIRTRSSSSCCPPLGIGLALMRMHELYWGAAWMALTESICPVPE
jgi:hypothetical protein